MADRSRIEWTDATWNPVTGCSPVSPGCDHCYAERMVKRFPLSHGLKLGETKWENAPFSEVRFHPDRLDQPLRWKKPRRIFVCSMGDLFHKNLPVADIIRVFEIMWQCPQHVFMILTKRHERMKAIMSGAIANAMGPGAEPAPHIWLGVTAENQEMADLRIPILLQTPAAKRFVSVEPMLGPVDLDGDGFSWKGWLRGWHCEAEPRRDSRGDLYPEPVQMENERLDWVICGGESGPGARPMHPDWPRSLRDQCQAAGVPFFFKQWGGWMPVRAAGLYRNARRIDYTDNVAMLRVGKKAAGRLLDGRVWDQVPEGVGKW